VRIIKLSMFALAAMAAVKGADLALDAASEGQDVPVQAQTDKPEAPLAEETRETTSQEVKESGISSKSPVLPEILADIAAERQAIELRRQALDEQEAELSLARAAIEAQMADLTQLGEKIEETLAMAESTHVEDISSLVKMYEGMKPEQAGSLLSDIDIEVATLVIAAMREAKAGPILAKMETRRAQAVSKIIFERSKLPGDQKPVRVQVN